MKKSIMLVSILFSSWAYAQSNVSSVRTSSLSDRNAQKGLYVGVDYMNLTDVHAKSELKAGGKTASASSEFGMSLGVAGIRLGYNQTPEQGLGFEAGARYLESFNASEYGDEKFKVIIPEASLKYAFNRYFLTYAGFNVSILTGIPSASKYTTGVGGQVGMGARLTQDLAFNAGYTMISQTYRDSSRDIETQAEFQFSGFNSNLTYTF